MFLNSSRIDFGKLLGIYVVLFFLVAQVVAKLQFHQSPKRSIYVGGAFVSIGGLIMTFGRLSRLRICSSEPLSAQKVGSMPILYSREDQVGSPQSSGHIG